jgi:antagonist of KipI
MSLEVIKAGIADSVQDKGRFGYQHLGINPTGAMDLNALQIANALVGNELNEAVIELKFPASSLFFRKSTIIALSGADFNARLNGQSISVNQPVLVPKNSELKFSGINRGSFCYLAIHGGFQITPWLESRSTNLKAKWGGVEGRFLKKGDVLKYKKHPLDIREIKVLPWQVNVAEFYPKNHVIRCLAGNEFSWLTKKSQAAFLKTPFTISPQSDRMGYRLKGVALMQSKKQELLSIAVMFGTIQLLPQGEIIILMADHQTTGGYPRIGHVISADRSKLVQFKANDKISFQWARLEEAESFVLAQHKSLKQLQRSCMYKLNRFLHDY